MTLIERREEGGLVVGIYQDDDPQYADPRECDNLAKLYCWHPDYILGDEQFGRGDHESMEDVVEFLFCERRAILVIPLFLLDHSGISMSYGRPLDGAAWKQADIEARGRFIGDEAGWDTTHVGFAYTTAEIVESLGVPNDPDEIRRQVVGEIEEYDKFLRGDVYGYVIEDEAGETIDSCWGFLGDEYFEEEVARAVEDAKETLTRERDQVAYWQARDVETVST
jgi:hypothetical protein